MAMGSTIFFKLSQIIEFFPAWLFSLISAIFMMILFSLKNNICPPNHTTERRRKEVQIEVLGKYGLHNTKIISKNRLIFALCFGYYLDKQIFIMQ